jgi:hypothetical protein
MKRQAPEEPAGKSVSMCVGLAGLAGSGRPGGVQAGCLFVEVVVTPYFWPTVFVDKSQMHSNPHAARGLADQSLHVSSRSRHEQSKCKRRVTLQPALRHVSGEPIPRSLPICLPARTTEKTEVGQTACHGRSRWIAANWRRSQQLLTHKHSGCSTL